MLKESKITGEQFPFLLLDNLYLNVFFQQNKKNCCNKVHHVEMVFHGKTEYMIKTHDTICEEEPVRKSHQVFKPTETVTAEANSINVTTIATIVVMNASNQELKYKIGLNILTFLTFKPYHWVCQSFNLVNLINIFYFAFSLISSDKSYIKLMYLIVTKVVSFTVGFLNKLVSYYQAVSFKLNSVSQTNKCHTWT
jgi:hypothetical protein